MSGPEGLGEHLRASAHHSTELAKGQRTDEATQSSQSGSHPSGAVKRFWGNSSMSTVLGAVHWMCEQEPARKRRGVESPFGATTTGTSPFSHMGCPLVGVAPSTWTRPCVGVVPVGVASPCGRGRGRAMTPVVRVATPGE